MGTFESLDILPQGVLRLFNEHFPPRFRRALLAFPPVAFAHLSLPTPSSLVIFLLG